VGAKKALLQWVQAQVGRQLNIQVGHFIGTTVSLVTRGEPVFQVVQSVVTSYYTVGDLAELGHFVGTTGPTDQWDTS